MESLQDAKPLQVNFSEVVHWLPAPETFPAGAILIDQNEQSGWVGVIAAGIVRLSSIDGDKIGQVIGLRSQGWWLNPEDSVLPLPSRLRVTALTEVKLIRMPAGDFLQLLEDSPKLARQVLRSQLTEKLLAGTGLSGFIGFRARRWSESRPSAHPYEDGLDSALAR